MLTQFGYESEPSFHLEVPEEIQEVEVLRQGESFELSVDGYQFLNSVALNAHLRYENCFIIVKFILNWKSFRNSFHFH
jgi:hypothetical protein